jgi:hypothetical protein
MPRLWARARAPGGDGAAALMLVLGAARRHPQCAGVALILCCCAMRRDRAALKVPSSYTAVTAKLLDFMLLYFGQA